jgi:mannose-6-phosphate isomerase-like protein (cupin superfamily)
MQKVNLFETGEMFCDIYCLEPGQKQKPHKHAGADKVYFVLEGQGKFSVGTETQILTSGMCCLAPSDVEHSVVNDTQERLVVLVFMAQNPNIK